MVLSAPPIFIMAIQRRRQPSHGGNGAPHVSTSAHVMSDPLHVDSRQSPQTSQSRKYRSFAETSDRPDSDPEQSFEANTLDMRVR
jgi:hypothetical protein